MQVTETYKFMQAVDATLPSLMSKGPYQISRPKYTIGGGAVRDSLLYRRVHDIDVCIWNMGDWDVDWTEYGTGDLKYDEGSVAGVSDTNLKVNGVPIQLVARTIYPSPNNLVSYHAIGLSNAFWLDGQLVLDKSFLKDASDQTITVNKGRWSEETLTKYLEKIQRKYQWPILIPA